MKIFCAGCGRSVKGRIKFRKCQNCRISEYNSLIKNKKMFKNQEETPVEEPKEDLAEEKPEAVEDTEEDLAE